MEEGDLRVIEENGGDLLEQGVRISSTASQVKEGKDGECLLVQPAQGKEQRSYVFQGEAWEE